MPSIAVEVDTEGLNLNTVGVILMIVGGIGIVLSMLFWSSFSPYGRRERVTTTGHDTTHGHDHL